MIFGAGDIALAAVEIFESNGVVVFGILDDRKEMEGKEFGNVAVISGSSDPSYISLVGKKCEAFIASDETALRKNLVKSLTKDQKAMPVNAIHPASSISPHSFVGHGNFVDRGVLIGAGAEIGNHCLIHSGAIIGHSARISDFVQIGQGANIGQGVAVGEGSFVGSGVHIVSGITVGKNSRIGAGSVVVENVNAGTTVFGNPAKKVQV